MRAWFFIVAALLAIVAVVQFDAFDIWLSDFAYDFDLGRWMVDHGSSTWRPFLYEGPKVLIVAFGLLLIAVIVRPVWLRYLWLSRQEAVFLFLSLAIVPAVVGIIRDHSGVSCPRSLQHYGGQIEDAFGQLEYTRFFGVTQAGKCWPSGHASGGFALLALAFLCRSTRTRRRLAALGLGTGAAMGIYQVLRGAHYISHVVVTMLMSLALIQVLRIVILEGACQRGSTNSDSRSSS